MENVLCNLCGNDDYKVLYDSTGPIEKKKGEYSASSSHILTDRVVQCKHCNLIYINPRPVGEAIVEDYADAVDETYVSQSRGRLKTFEEGVSLIEKYVPKGKLLDVGAAAGFFVYAAQMRGWKAQGVEPSRWLVGWGKKNLQVALESGTLEEKKYPEGSFDVVTFWDVLEHVPDPLASLKEANRVLRKGGVVAINYPNIASNMAKLAGRKWWFLLSVHLWYFTPETIQKMLEKAGYEVFYTKRHWQKLSLGYLVYRIKPYNKFLHGILDKVVGGLGLQDRQITYYASQTLVLARKK